MAYKNRRKWAATEIQRHTRGILARRVAYSRVLAFVDNQFVHIGRERYVAFGAFICRTHACLKARQVAQVLTHWRLRPVPLCL
jgi:hypothetical protein